MKGDYSRKTFNKRKNYSGVYLQQGRILLDSDFNEQREITDHFLRSLIRDIIGPCGAPLKNAGFKIIPSKGEYNIGSGHYYVDGILCVNEDEVAASSQPYYPVEKGSVSPPLPETDGLYLVYLDVWERDITCVDDEEILEPALGGVDTTTRLKIVWQVEFQRVKTRLRKKFEDCTRLFSVPLRISSGKMRVRNADFVDNCDDLSPASGYTGLENMLYRVEIHDGGDCDSSEPPTFKWSNCNGIDVAKVSEISGDSMTIGFRQGADVDFSKRDWIEVTDDLHEFHGMPGSFVRIREIEDDVISYDPSSTYGNSVSCVNYPLKFNPIIRKWDGMKNPVLPVIRGNEGEYISLEDGVEIQFTEGVYRSGDYWMFPVRTNVGVLWEKEDGLAKFKPPIGIEHHYCPLALIKYQKNEIKVLSDCRKFFPTITDLFQSRMRAQLV